MAGNKTGRSINTECRDFDEKAKHTHSHIRSHPPFPSVPGRKTTKRQQEACLPHKACTSVSFLQWLLPSKGWGMETGSMGVQKVGGQVWESTWECGRSQ